MSSVLGGVRSGHVPMIRWYLTTDSDMSYSIFRGIEPPRLDRLSGKMRWYGSGNCVMVLTSCGSPEMFAQVFGVPMDAMECREIAAQSIKFLDRKCDRVEVPRNWPTVSDAVDSPSQGRVGAVEADVSVRAASIKAGQWFMMHDHELGLDVLCNMVDQCMCAMYIEGKTILSDVHPDEPCRFVPADQVFLPKWVKR